MLGWELPPHNSGGLGVACYQLCKSLANQNIDIEFIVPYQGDHDIDFMTVTTADPKYGLKMNPLLAYESGLYGENGINYEGLDIFTQHRIYENAVAKLVEAREFDIVHAHDWLTFRAAMRVKEIKGCPVILHVHSIESDRAGHGLGNPIVREIEESSMYMADKVIAVSEHTKQAIMREYGLPGEAIDVIHNSIDADDITPLDTINSYAYLTLLKQAGYKVVTNFGRITIQKGLSNLLLAAQKVLSLREKTIFLIVGSGEQQSELIEQAADLGIGPNVLFADFQRGKRLRDAQSIGDLFVMPSVSEPFGITPLEAIGYGTPVLISKQSGVSEVLKNCLKVDFWDIDEMANQITSALENDAVLHEMLINSQNELAKMSWGEASQKINDIYASQTSETA